MWTITQSESGYHVIHDDEGDYLIAFQREDIARRVVASVNACAGIGVEALERIRVSADMAVVEGGEAARQGLERSM